MGSHAFGNLNIHFFGAEAGAHGHQACYYVIRPFGNYLIFGLDRLPIDAKFMKAKGGVYKQLLTRLEQVTAQGKKFFTTFGCSAVLPPDADPEHFDPELRFEVYQTHFSDKDIHYRSFGDGHWIHLRNHAGRGILFPDESLLLDNGRWVVRSRPTPQQIEALQDLKVDVVLPRLFTGASPYQGLSPEIYRNKIEDLRGQSGLP